MSILAEEFPGKLSAFNDVSRCMRTAGVEICALMLTEHRIFIEPSSAQLLLNRFGQEVRGICYLTQGRFTCNTVKIRGVEVVWLTQVKEQEQ
ncbi:hypothetical protein [Pseudomonas sp. 18175]|uniref:hypothetical protein n=1 Tax=Pseudomonas sp. 18175 TaxID=3390056 RepID=UPI003D1FFC60